jgi:GR25 family glycosyltransferase involved in LPS biosynthesis
MKIFIIHYKILLDRRKHILYQFQKYNITDYEFIEIDRDELSEQNTSMFEINYNKSQIAISLSHFYAYKQISEKYENALILEDDVLLCENFVMVLNLLLYQLPKDFDMLFIGDGCNLHIENHKLIPNKYIYEKCLHPTVWGGDGASRCTDSYIVNKKCAIKLCDYITNLTTKNNIPIDFWLNNAARDNDLKIYWSEPTIVTQGSQIGLFKSSHQS